MRQYYPEARHFIVNERSIEDRPFLGIIRIPGRGQIILPEEGISQEIFCNGVYAHSIGPNFNGKPPKVHKGDYIYSISLLPRAYSFDGFIITKDGQQQGYDMHTELKVVNPTRFMEKYDNKQDLAWGVFTQFKQVFEYYASKLEDTTGAKIGPWLEKQIVMLSQTWGIQVMHPTWFLHVSYGNRKDVTKEDDKKHVAQRRMQELDIEYDLKIHEERLKRRFESVHESLLREEKARKNNFARSEQKKGQVVKEQIRLLSSTVDGLVQINNNRIDESMGYNLPAQGILKDLLKLLASLNNSLDNSSQQVDTILDSTLSDETLFEEDAEEDGGPITTVGPTNSEMDDKDEDRELK